VYKKAYQIIEHTADIGIRVKAKDPQSLFKNSALAMFDIIAERKHSAPVAAKEIRIEVKADNLEELFINWLNELLSLSSAKELIFSDFKISKIDKNTLQVMAVGEDMINYKVNTEIKAATYHQRQIEENTGGRLTEVMFGG